jgi:hypothetical protein
MRNFSELFQFFLYKQSIKKIIMRNFSELFQFFILLSNYNMPKPFNIIKTVITNLDLYSFNFPINVLEKNIDSLDLITLIRTQKLSYEFIIKYILNNEYQITPEEKTIDIYDVVNNQPHIDLEQLKKLILSITK